MRVPIRLRRLSLSIATETTTLSQTLTCQLITHQHSATMRISHMEVEHNKVQDQCRIFNYSMLHRDSKDSNNKGVRKQKIQDKGDLNPLKIKC